VQVAQTQTSTRSEVQTGGVDPAWPPNGLAVCALAGRQQAAALLGQGVQGAIITWSDSRTTDPGIYAMHLFLNGIADPGWPADGLKVCSAVNSVAFPGIATDGIGGAIIGWTDFRADASNSDIYAQHVRANGIVDPGWPVNGAARIDRSQYANKPRAYSGRGGRSITTWTDLRSGSTGIDIYAQRVRANGELGGPAVDVPAGDFQGIAFRVWPNPARGAALSVSCSVPNGETALLELLDLSGRRIAGRSIVGARLTASFPEASRLPAGLYFLRLRDGKHSRIFRVTLLR
jgi:hypothetical protein